MNLDNKLNKFFVVQMVILSLIAVLIIINEVYKYSQLQEIKNQITNSRTLLNLENVSKLDEANLRYLDLKNSINSENYLGELINFIENRSEIYNLTIRNSKVLSVTDDEVLYEITVQGTLDEIANFIQEIESDTNIKEIVKSEIKIDNSRPSITIVIRNIKL